MLRAEQDVQEQLGRLRLAFNQARQEEISEDLLDIIAGVMAIARRIPS